ncbi:hypothetical protein Pan216_26380 [Planctomycetes bacterium Pan216]|uniref:Uncharacterized protein n=1 Tax=Kolteria novifilia TaxID=2527975 RepID=A0A518B448_9BACT|nr:hypothetical protein Pan216_26380 [Planctomycetes bacterium Pan216]
MPTTSVSLSCMPTTSVSLSCMPTTSVSLSCMPTTSVGMGVAHGTQEDRSSELANQDAGAESLPVRECSAHHRLIAATLPIVR